MRNWSKTPVADGLKRQLGPGLLTLYGIGTMVGAGIYVLVGAAAGAAGLWAPLAFLVAGVLALPTALAYAELSAGIPEAAGESAYVELGLGRHRLAVVVGLLIVASGMISAAAVLRGGVGYLTGFMDVAPEAAIPALGALLVLVAIWGALESLALAGLLTLIELTGLGMVIWAGFEAPQVADWRAAAPPELPGMAVATLFAFFAFLGFEDMVNMAEETRNPARDMPRAILGALAVTAVLYALVSVAAIRAVPVADLAGSDRPLALVWQAAQGGEGQFLSAIAVAAAINGVLAQIVMAARVLYGLGRRSPALAVFRHTSARFGTPVLATLTVGGAVIVAALMLPVAELAGYATQVLLVVFTVVNAALIGLKRQTGRPPAPFQVPIWVPVLGLVGSLAVLAGSLWPV